MTLTDASRSAMHISIFGPSYRYYGFYSIHARVLPYLDQLTVYSSINFSLGTAATSNAIRRGRQCPDETALNTQVNLFLCPSDAGPFEETGTNYRGNIGVGPLNTTSIEFPDSNNGLFPELDIVRAAYVPDGLSHTAAFSERLRGSGPRKREFLSVIFGSRSAMSVPPTTN